MGRYKLTAVFSLILFASVSVFSFVTFPKAFLTSDKNDIVTGEKVKVRIEILIPSFAELVQNEDDIIIDGWDILDLSFKKDVVQNDRYILDMIITTFDVGVKEIPQIGFSYTNKDDSDNGEKFFFFSNSVPVTVKSSFNKNEFKTIRDIKYPKALSVPLIYYIAAFLFSLYVIFFSYRNVLKDKIVNVIKLNGFTPGEVALRKLNNLKIEENCSKKQLKGYYFLISNIFKQFIVKASGFHQKEKTTTELLELLNDKNNVFNIYSDEINKLFENFDNAKYSDYMLNKETFLDVYKQTKQIIERYQQYVREKEAAK